MDKNIERRQVALTYLKMQDWSGKDAKEFYETYLQIVAGYEEIDNEIAKRKSENTETEAEIREKIEKGERHWE